MAEEHKLITWRTESKYYADDQVKADIEKHILNGKAEIIEAKKFLMTLENSSMNPDGLFCFVTFGISDFGRIGDREGSFYLQLSRQGTAIVWSAEKARSSKKDEPLEISIADFDDTEWLMEAGIKEV